MITVWPILLLGRSAIEGGGMHLFGLASGMLLYPLAIVAHELGHALTAQLLGLQIGAVAIGYGPTLWRFEIARIPIQIHAWPLSGRVYFGSQSLRLLRTKLWFATLMGPIINVILIAATVHWWDVVGDNFGQWLPTMCVVVNFILVVTNLMPYHLQDLGGTQRSDGLALLQIPRTPESELRVYLYAAPLIRSLFRFDAADFEGANSDAVQGLERSPDNAWLAVLESSSFAFLGNYTAARSSLVPFLQNGEIPEAPIRAALWNCTAFAALMENPDAEAGSASLGQADEYSSASFGLYPCVLAYRSTRSLVMSAFGRCNEALQLLNYVLYGSASPRERSHQEAARAFALRKSGRTREARDAARRAAQLDSTTSTFLLTLGL